ncbi:hypothetical protein Tco_0390116 [Tanacetum coccineum]
MLDTPYWGIRRMAEGDTPFEEGLSKTLAGEETPINDVPRMNAAFNKSIMAHLVHTTLEYPEHSNFFLNLYSMGGRGLTSSAPSSLAHGSY